MAKYKKRNRRHRGKKRGSRIFWALFTFLLVAGAIVASLTVFLKVSKIEVKGNNRYTAEEIIESSGIKPGDNLYGVNKFSVIDKIESDFPYIETIKITRRLPDTFVFNVTERVPCGYIEGIDCRWLVDHKGYLLERVEKDAQVTGTLVIAEEELVAPVAGSKINWATEGKYDALIVLLGEFKERGILEKVTAVDVGAIYSLQFTYEDRIVVTLGTTEDVGKKLNMLDAVLPKLAPTDRGKLNLSKIGEARFTPERIVYDEK